MSSAAEPRERKDWPHLLSAGAHVGAVFGILVAGAMLQTPPGARGPAAVADRLPSTVASALPEERRAPIAPLEPRAGQEPAPSRLAAGPAVVQTASPAVADESSGLARRAKLDAERLARLGDGYTLQAAMLCDPAGVRAHLDRHGNREPFHVLPVDRAGRSCYRLCWGHYPTAEAARRAKDLPGTLASAGVFPTPVSAVLE
jgi:septal ring-binding cell division protein DamX